MKILITICARGGSKGIPGKNIKPVNGVPLIGYSINIARKFAAMYDCDIALSSDSDEIINVAKKFGLYTDYKRPIRLATDEAGKIEVISDLLLYMEKYKKSAYDYVLDLDVTSPLRTIDDLTNALKVIESDPACLNLFSVNLSRRNPYFNMVEKKTNGYFSTVRMPEQEVFTRQSVPKVFDMNASFYFYRRKFFELNLKSSITEASLVYEMPHICFDLDEPHDYEYLSFLIQEKKLDFQI